MRNEQIFKLYVIDLLKSATLMGKDMQLSGVGPRSV